MGLNLEMLDGSRPFELQGSTQGAGTVALSRDLHGFDELLFVVTYNLSGDLKQQVRLDTSVMESGDTYQLLRVIAAGTSASALYVTVQFDTASVTVNVVAQTSYSLESVSVYAR